MSACRQRTANAAPLADPMLSSFFAPSGLASRLPIATVAWDQQGKILGWNQAAEGLFGWPATDALALSVYELLPPDHRTAALEAGLLVPSARRDEPQVLECQTRQGQRIRCEWSQVTLCGRSECRAGLALVRDVTGASRAERERERLQEIATGANAALDLDQILLLVRDAAIEVGGMDRAGVWLLHGDVLHGSWGTDEHGNLLDERARIERVADAIPCNRRLLAGEVPYTMSDLELVETPDGRLEPGPARTVYAAVPLRARGEVIGLVSVDNLITQRPIAAADIEALIPFCDQLAVTIANVRLLAERTRMVEHHQRLLEISSAINAGRPLDDILLMIRNAMVEVAGYDRAGVWYVEGDVLRGSWGTDFQGNLVDERGERSDPELFATHLDEMARAGNYETVGIWQPDGDVPDHLRGATPYAWITLVTDGQVVGYVSVDNLLTKRPIANDDIRTLMPYGEQGALAARKAHLVAEQERQTRRQESLIEVSVAVNAGRDLDDILLALRTALITVGGFDRAGIWQLKDGVFYGSWGTDYTGNLQDERSLSVPLDDFLPYRSICGSSAPYVIDSATDIEIDDGTYYDIFPHATIAMRADDELIGLLCVDNMITRRIVGDEHVRPLLAFAEQGAIALRNARLVAERNAHAERQRRLMAMSAAMNAGTDLMDILLMVRNALVDVGGFDRAGVWWVDDAVLRGSWGTDTAGQLTDERSFELPMSDPALTANVLIREGLPFVRMAWADVPGAQGNARIDLPRVEVAMRAGGAFVGLVSVDNLVSGRSITDAMIEMLLPFAEQAAVAVRNARLLAERERSLDRQRRLADLATAITARTSLPEILRMVRDAAVEAAGFDRAGVFLYDSARRFVQGAWGTDRNGELEDLRHVGYVIDGLEGSPVMAVLQGKAPYCLEQDFHARRQLSPEHGMYGVTEHATVALTADGEVVGIVSVDNLISGRPVREKDVLGLLPFAGQAAVAVQNAKLFDQLRQAQDALVRSERLRAVGELASGVAHNINNILTAVLGYAELIQREDDAPDQVKQYAGIIERAAVDGAEIVGRVQQFARREAEADFAPVDLAEIAHDAVNLIRPMWQKPTAGSGVRVVAELDLPARLPSVGVASEIREVVVNLIKNATEAMPEGGILTVRGYRDGQQAVLEVTDTGAGMDEPTCKRVFEPFFTTKGTGLGTGLGLSVAWGTIRRHNGNILVRSEQGVGSTFTVRLPFAPEEQPIQPHEPAESALDGLRVLVVDDEQFVAQGITEMLRGRGASVDTASSGPEALERLAHTGANYAAVVTDHGMPGMTGLQLLAAVAERFPAVRRLVLSGWGASLSSDPEAPAAERILAKPVKAGELAAAILQLVGRQE